MNQYKQRQVVKVEAMLPDGKMAVHPFVILSCQRASSKENYYTGVMMTHADRPDHFNFPLDDSMFERPLEKKNCQLRLYIIVSFPGSKVTQLMSVMQLFDFKRVLKEIKDYVLISDE